MGRCQIDSLRLVYIFDKCTAGPLIPLLACVNMSNNFSSQKKGGADPRILEGPFYAHTIAPLLESPRRIEGIRRYIRGLDWALVDELSEIHGRLEIPVIFVWGAQDQTFPVKQAREMVSQIPGCRGFHEVQGARLLPQMERPDEVARHVVGFLRS